MVDPVELRLVDVLVELVGERAADAKVVAERLLDDDPAPSVAPALARAADHRAEQGRRDLEVEHRAAASPRRLRRLVEGLGVAEVTGT